MITTATKTLSPGEREQRIKENLPLVKFCVRTMNLRNGPAGLDFDDLVGHGTIGLLQAVDRFDDSFGVKFSNFALTRIRGAIIDALRAVDPVGRSSRQACRSIAEHFNALAFELGRDPTPKEVQRSTNIGEAQYWSARNAASMKLVSFELPLRDGPTLAETLDDHAAPVSSDIEDRELTSALKNAVAGLPLRDQTLLSLYYGKSLTMKEVGHAMSISETRVSQLLMRAYARLRANTALAAAA